MVFIGVAGICRVNCCVLFDGDKASMISEGKGVWFIYDGECPLCTQAALALRIKEVCGPLNLLNARENNDHPLVQHVNTAGYDLDEGMVIVNNGECYHGKDALRFMAKYSEGKGAFTLFTKLLYWSETIATITYPWLRAVRNIDNLNVKQDPIFKPIFGSDWESLPVVMKKHYANRPYSNDVTIVEGNMDIACAGFIKYLSPLLWLMGSIPPINATNVPVTVSFESDKNTKAFYFNRVFYFNNRKPYHFRSRMIQIKGNELVELMRFGLCWRLQCLWDEGKVKLKHRGYALHLCGHFIPIPLTLLLGAGNAEEIALDDNHFAMCVDIIHPWWGNIYTYKGQFSVQKKQ
jgi:predicted DCC family thiol-disulfide oxidoreductase YuxK